MLYPAPLRDFLMRLGLSGRFRARWTRLIHDEWQRNLLKNRADLNAGQVERTARLMDAAIPDALVTGFEPLIDGLALPDADDRHVLAAAIRCGASVIVTFNEKDFPATVLRMYGVEAQHPDVFVDDLFDLDRAAVVNAARLQRASLRHPEVDVVAFLGMLRKQGLVRTVRALTEYRAVL